MLDIEAIRKQFPILDQQVFGHDLVYLDSAATMQMPQQVLQAITRHYQHNNANVHRGIHALSERSTAALEQARKHVASFINAPSADTIVFTSGTTGGLNMLADMWFASEGLQGAVVSTMMEHHANIVPWQQACARTGARFLLAPLTGQGELNLAQLEPLIAQSDVRLLAVTYVSNVLGTVNPLPQIIQMAHAYNVAVVVDAAQGARHEPLDVEQLDCDFLVFSGHKIGAPTGIGVLYVSPRYLQQLKPVRFGGEMVKEVTITRTTFEQPPLCFEPGTPNYVGAIGLDAALDYLEDIGLSEISMYEHQLVHYAEQRLRTLEGVCVLGNPVHRAGCISFTVQGAHPFDIATMVDKLGVALRSGNQCAQPLLHQALGVQNVTRLSPAFYNTASEIDSAIQALERVLTLLRK